MEHVAHKGAHAISHDRLVLWTTCHTTSRGKSSTEARRKGLGAGA